MARLLIDRLVVRFHPRPPFIIKSLPGLIVFAAASLRELLWGPRVNQANVRRRCKPVTEWIARRADPQGRWPGVWLPAGRGFPAPLFHLWAIEKHRRMIFDRMSEKLSGELERQELRLEEPETTQAATRQLRASEQQQPSTPKADSKPRSSRPGRKPLPEDLPCEMILHMPEHECCLRCGGQLRQFGSEVSERIGPKSLIEPRIGRHKPTFEN